MKKWLLFTVLGLMLFITGCQSESASKGEEQVDNENTKLEDYVYTKYELDTKAKAKLGDTNSENTIVLAFDYSCPWCHKWMGEVLPILQKKYIDTGLANYTGQPLVLLNEKSLLFAHVDQFIEANKPKSLYEMQVKIANESSQDNWGTEGYVQDLLATYGIEKTIEEVKGTNFDPISITRIYTKNYGVAAVPTLYINGIKLYDAFNLDEIEMALNGEIKGNDVIKIPVKN